MKDRQKRMKNGITMLHKTFNRLFLIALTAALVFSTVVPEDAFARRGGGFRFGRSRASSWGVSKSKRSGQWNRSKGGVMRSRRGRAAGTMSRADRKLYRKARANGTVYSKRSQAKQAFSRKYGNRYPSKYGSKPAKRPNHIPQTTTVDSRKYPVEYNPVHRGYGYYGPGGTWIAYSVMRDAAMLSLLMNRHSYYYGPQPVRSGGGIFTTGFLILAGIVLFSFMMRPRF